MAVDDKLVSCKCMTADIDPGFYKIVAGRPCRRPSALQSYIEALRRCFQTRLHLAWVQEELRAGNEARKRAQDQLEVVQQASAVQAGVFDAFLNEEHQTSQECLAAARAIRGVTKLQSTKLSEQRHDLESTQARVTRSTQQWHHCNKLEWFFHAATPQESQPPTSQDHDGLLASSKQPQQVVQVLHHLEYMNQGALLQCERLEPSRITITQAHKDAASAFAAERDAYQADVAALLRDVVALETKALELKRQAMALAAGQIKHQLVDQRAIAQTACLDHAYETVVGPNASGLGPMALMRALQTSYECLRLELDLMPPALVSHVTAMCERRDQLGMEQATDAQKKVHQMDTLVKRFCAASSPWTGRMTQRRRLVSRMPPPPEKPAKRELHKTITPADERGNSRTRAPHEMYQPLVIETNLDEMRVLPSTRN